GAGGPAAAAGPAGTAPAERGAPGVIVVDIDRFTAGNDVRGQTAGDLLLAQVARRPRVAVSPGGTGARWGGGGVAVLAEGEGSGGGAGRDGRAGGGGRGRAAVPDRGFGPEHHGQRRGRAGRRQCAGGHVAQRRDGAGPGQGGRGRAGRDVRRR